MKRKHQILTQNISTSLLSELDQKVDLITVLEIENKFYKIRIVYQNQKTLLVIHLHVNDHQDIQCTALARVSKILQHKVRKTIGPRQANLVLIAYASSEGSGEPAHPRSLARTSAARSYKQ